MLEPWISESLFWTDRNEVTNEGLRRRLHVYYGSLRRIHRGRRERPCTDV